MRVIRDVGWLLDELERRLPAWPGYPLRTPMREGRQLPLAYATCAPQAGMATRDGRAAGSQWPMRE